MEKIMEHLKEAVRLITGASLDVDQKSAVHNAGVEVLVQLGTLEKVTPIQEGEVILEDVLEENKSLIGEVAALKEDLESLRILTGAQKNDIPGSGSNPSSDPDSDPRVRTTPGTETPDPENKEPQA